MKTAKDLLVEAPDLPDDFHVGSKDGIEAFKEGYTFWKKKVEEYLRTNSSPFLGDIFELELMGLPAIGKFERGIETSVDSSVETLLKRVREYFADLVIEGLDVFPDGVISCYVEEPCGKKLVATIKRIQS